MDPCRCNHHSFSRPECQFHSSHHRSNAHISVEISASYPEVKEVYIGQGAHVTIDSLNVSPYLIVKVKSDSSMSDSSLEQFKKWLRVRLQTDNIEVDHTVITE